MLRLMYDHSNYGNPEIITDVYLIESDLDGEELIKAIAEKTGIPHTRDYVLDRENYRRLLSRYFFVFTSQGERLMAVDTYRSEEDESI